MTYSNVTTEVSTAVLFMLVTISNNLNFFHYRIKWIRNNIILNMFYTSEWYCRFMFIDLETYLPYIVKKEDYTTTKIYNFILFLWKYVSLCLISMWKFTLVKMTETKYTMEFRVIFSGLWDYEIWSFLLSLPIFSHFPTWIRNCFCN